MAKRTFYDEPLEGVISSYKDYMVDRVKKVIASCKTKEKLLVAIDYAALASVEIEGRDGEEASAWMDYFRPIIFDRVKELKKTYEANFELAQKWVQRRYNG